MAEHTLDDILRMGAADLRNIVFQGAALEPDVLADTTYTGIDLSMPAWFHRLMWKSFRKTFHRDPVTGVLRGWNVRVEQTGWDTPPAPLRSKGGHPKTFGHYEVREAKGERFPEGWQGGHYLDYRFAGNTFLDFPARAGFCPLVAVNPGSMDLLLGWEIFRVGNTLIPLKDYWVLVREGPLAPADIISRPVPSPRELGTDERSGS